MIDFYKKVKEHFVDSIQKESKFHTESIGLFPSKKEYHQGFADGMDHCIRVLENVESIKSFEEELRKRNL